ncbi:MAG TPA: crosslink repair DNA glycosylase YcaQ family protein, partial [Thermoanaerobaculia bacterium]
DEPTYALLADWVPAAAPPLSTEDALAALGRRYFRAYGPAGAEDFAAWAGRALGPARRTGAPIVGELAAVEIDGVPAWLAADADAPLRAQPPWLRLLPAFDTYLLGYESRDLALAPRFAKRIQAGGGWIHPAVVVDGRVVGTWRQERRGKALEVSVAPFEPLDSELRPQLESEAADVGRFLGLEATLDVAEP